MSLPRRFASGRDQREVNLEHGALRIWNKRTYGATLHGFENYHRRKFLTFVLVPLPIAVLGVTSAGANDSMARGPEGRETTLVGREGRMSRRWGGGRGIH